MICFLIVTKKERCCVRGREESAGVKQRRKEAQKRVGPKLTGQTLLTHRREPLSYFLVLYILYIYMFSLWRRTFARAVQTLVPPQLFAIAMATFSCWVHRRWFVSRHSAGSVAYIISFVLLLSLLTLFQVLFNTPSAAMYLLRNLI